MNPVIEPGIPIYIRNTFAPGDAGTCIGRPEWGRVSQLANAEDTVRGFSNVDNLALFNLEGSGLVGVVGAASKLFASLQRGNRGVCTS